MLTMRDSRRAFLVAAVTLLQGCATTQLIPMNPEASAALKQAPVVQVVRYESNGMLIMTPKSVAGAGLLASATGSSELPTGLTLARAYKLPDPADDLSRRLVEKLKAEGRLNNLRVDSKMLPRPLVEDTSHYRSRGQAGLVLEVTVEGHGAGYGAINWRTYTYGLNSRAKLIRLSDGKVLWFDACSLHNFSEDSAKRQLDVSDFEANGGARLKQVFHYSNERCSRILADKLLGTS